MANFERRLPVYSSSDADIDWRLSDDEVRSFELTYHAISGEALAALHGICRRFMHWKRVEMNAGRASDAVRIWRSAKAAIESFASIAGGGGFPEGDEGQYVQETFLDALAQIQIQLTEHDFHPDALDLALWGEDAPVAEAILHLRTTFLTRFAQALWMAISKTESEFANAGNGLMPGDAFPGWLMDMKEWAKQYGYQHGGSSSTKPSKFVSFLYNLNKLFPEDYREPVNSMNAMNDRLRRAKRQITATE
jgi:hypothetical protein